MMAPLALKLLRDLCRFDTGGVLWTGAGRIRHAYMLDSPAAEEVMPLYVSEYFGRRERDVIIGFNEARCQSGKPLHLRQILRVPRSYYYRHDFYGETMGPAGFHNNVRMTLNVGGDSIGLLLGRSPQRADFEEEDMRLLQYAAPFLRQSLHLVAGPEESQIDSGDSALVVTDVRGRLCQASPQGRRLVVQMCGPQYDHLRPGKLLPEPLLKVIAGLHTLLRTREGERPPVMEHCNGWGRFRLHAYPLAYDHHGPDGPIGLHIQRQVPITVHLQQVVRALRLSPRQSQVCLLMLRRQTEPEIAKTLGVRVSSVIHHRRQLYNQLGVQSREQLREALMRWPA